MKARQFIWFSLVLFASIQTPVSGQSLPELPHTCSIITKLPDLQNFTIKTVGPVNRDYKDLQQAIDAAQGKCMLVLDAGATFKGSFRLPKKSINSWIIITSSAMANLPPENQRVRPSDAMNMPKIMTTNLSGLPTFYTEHGASYYRLIGLEITADTAVKESYGLVQLGNGFNSSIQNTLSQQARQIIIDRCYIHGHSFGNIMKCGVRLDCAESAIIDSYISDFHSIGYDAQAIAGVNGSGPFKIINNYLEASGENLLFGGGVPSIPDLVPSDIEILRNHFYKPFSWRTTDPSYRGNHWTIKNLFELKTGKRILLDGNILENSWADLPIGQSGYAILLTVRNEDGKSPQADISDVTISNNVIRNCGAGISISGHDDNTYLSINSRRIQIFNNLCYNLNGSLYGDNNIYGPNDGVFIKIGDPQDVLIDHNTCLQTGAITWIYDTIYSFKLTNNLFNCTLSKGAYQGIYGPGFARGGNKVMAAYLPNVRDDNHLFDRNVFIQGSSLDYSNYQTKSTNYFPVSIDQVEFTDPSNASSDYHSFVLKASSSYSNKAIDQTAIGVNFARLDSAQNSNYYDCKITNTNEERIALKWQAFFTSDHSLYLRFEEIEAQRYLINIFDISGKSLCYQIISKSESSIQLPTLPAGIYFVSVSSSFGIFSKKLIQAY